MTQINKIKTVNFMGADLMAAQDNEGVIWAGVSFLCSGMGLSKSQKDTQVEKIQTDKALKQGCRKFPAGVFDPNNATIALKLDFVPLWLAKISITPNMEEETPEIAEKLMQYQLKAKDVLAAAFLPNGTYTLTPNKRYQPPTISPEYYNGVAKLVNANQKIMAAQGCTPQLIAEQTKIIYAGAGIPVVRGFVKPSYEQLKITTTTTTTETQLLLLPTESLTNEEEG